MARGLLDGGVDLLLVETVYDLLSGKAAIAACHRAMVRRGRVVPDPGAGDHRADRSDAAGHRDRRRDHRAQPHWAWTSSGSTARPDRSRCTNRCANSASPRRCPCRACPTPACPAWSTARCTTTSRPDALAEHLGRSSSPSTGCAPSGAAAARRPAHLAEVVDARAPAHARDARARARAGRRVDLLVHPLPPGHVGPAGRRTHQRQRFQEVPRRDARRRLGHLRGHRARPDQGGRAPPRRLRRLHRGRRRRRHERGDEPPGHAVVGADHGRHDRDARRAHRAHLARRQGASSTRSTSKRARAPARASTDSWASPPSSARPSSPPASTRRARRVPRSGRCASRARITDLAVTRYGLGAEDVFIDALALPLSTGMVESRRDGIETIEAIRRIKAELPGVRTILGLSNVSFGLNPAARQVLNSVFLHECAEAGLDAAIVHAAKLLPLDRIDERGATGLPRPHLRPAHRRLRPADRAARSSSRERPSRPRASATSRASSSTSACADASSTGCAPDSRATSTRRWPRAPRRWTSSTTSCSTACARSATSSRAARCSCPSSCRAPRP